MPGFFGMPALLHITVRGDIPSPPDSPPLFRRRFTLILACPYSERQTFKPVAARFELNLIIVTEGGPMIKRLRWYIFLTVVLTSLSLVLYGIQIAIFHRTEDTLFYMLQDVAFVPIQVLFVTFIIARLLSEREKRALFKKLNMLVGAFYSEAGTQLIKYCSGFSQDLSDFRQHLLIRPDWSDKQFSAAIKVVRRLDPKIDASREDLGKVRDFLEDRRDFLLSLLANPNLLEHEAFTDLLWAVFHLSEELSSRPALEGLPRKDYDHLAGDMKRAFVKLLEEWLAYMKHLKKDYPYLFSLAVRTNPMDINASAVVSS
jgi:hypothetical protein